MGSLFVFRWLTLAARSESRVSCEIKPLTSPPLEMSKPQGLRLWKVLACSSEQGNWGNTCFHSTGSESGRAFQGEGNPNAKQHPVFMVPRLF